MSKSNVERQSEYRAKRLNDSRRVSVWISRLADAKLQLLAAKRNTSREKVISDLLEAA